MLIRSIPAFIQGVVRRIGIELSEKQEEGQGKPLEKPPGGEMHPATPEEAEAMKRIQDEANKQWYRQ